MTTTTQEKSVTKSEATKELKRRALPKSDPKRTSTRPEYRVLRLSKPELQAIVGTPKPKSAPAPTPVATDQAKSEANRVAKLVAASVPKRQAIRGAYGEVMREIALGAYMNQSTGNGIAEDYIARFSA